MRNHDDNGGMTSSGSERDDEIGTDEKIGRWSADDDDGGVLAGDEDVGPWSDEESVEERYQVDEGETPDSWESRWGSDDTHSRR